MPEISPRLIDGILVIMLAEFSVLSLFLVWRRAHNLITPLSLFLLSGGFLMMAVRGALADAGDGFLGALLSGALVSHLALLRWAAQKFLRN